MIDQSKLLPHDEESEKGVIGAFLIHPLECGSICGQIITPEMFFSPVRRAIYENLMAMWTEEAPIDLVTLTSWLRARGILEEVGGAAAVSEYFGYLPSAANVSHYAEMVAEKHALRQVIKLSTMAVEAAYGHDRPQDLIDGLARDLGQIGVRRSEPKSNKAIAREILEELQSAFENRGQPKDILKTGFHAIDAALGGGLRSDDYVLLTGPTKGGKSVLAQNILENVSATYSRPALVFSLEMGVKSYVYRHLSSTGGILLHRMRSGFLDTGDFARVEHAVGKFAASKVFIRDDVRDLVGIVSVSRQMKARHPDLSVIVVDYVQLIQRAMAKGENREQVVAAISTTLRNLQLELGVPVIVLAQENDSGAARESRRLEQDCTLRLKIEQVKDEPGLRVIAVPLARNGPPCAFRLAFRGEFMRFENLKEEEEK